MRLGLRPDFLRFPLDKSVFEGVGRIVIQSLRPGLRLGRFRLGLLIRDRLDQVRDLLLLSGDPRLKRLPPVSLTRKGRALLRRGLIPLLATLLGFPLRRGVRLTGGCFRRLACIGRFCRFVNRLRNGFCRGLGDNRNIGGG